MSRFSALLKSFLEGVENIAGHEAISSGVGVDPIVRQVGGVPGDALI